MPLKYNYLRKEKKHMKKFMVPHFAFVGFTNQVAFAKKCNFACRNDDCSNLQFK